MSLTGPVTDVLAHQGGWDEMAMLGGPVIVIGVLGYLARKGITKAGDPEDEQEGPGDDDHAASASEPG